MPEIKKKELHKDWIHNSEQFLTSAFMPFQNEKFIHPPGWPQANSLYTKETIHSFSQQCLLKPRSSGIWVCVVLLKHTNISEDATVSTFGTAVFKMEATNSFQMLIHIYAATWHRTQKNAPWHYTTTGQVQPLIYIIASVGTRENNLRCSMFILLWSLDLLSYKI
jgi:hypothetical protein